MVAVNLITADKTTTIAEQGTPALEVSGAKVKQMLNEVSSASLSFPATNKAAQSLLGTNRPVIEILDGNERVFYGAVVSATKDIFGNVNIECDGAMSFLSDIVKDPFSVNNRTPANYLETIITQYNAAVSDERKVWFGGASGFESYGNVNIAHSDEFTDTLTLVKELVEIYGGYIVETYGSGATHPYIGWIKTINADSGRVLEFGVNELTLDNKLDFGEYASRVYAHGSGNLTKTVVNADAEAAWGRRDLAYKSNAETQSELDAEAAAILASVSTPIQSIELTALDLEQLGHNYSGFVLGTTATMLDAHFGINMTVMVNTVERDLIDKQNGKIILGRAPATLTNSLVR